MDGPADPRVEETQKNERERESTAKNVLQRKAILLLCVIKVSLSVTYFITNTGRGKGGGKANKNTNTTKTKGAKERTT